MRKKRKTKTTMKKMKMRKVKRMIIQMLIKAMKDLKMVTKWKTLKLTSQHNLDREFRLQLLLMKIEIKFFMNKSLIFQQ